MIAEELKEQGYDKEEEYFKKLEREMIEKLKKRKAEREAAKKRGS